MKVYCLDIEGYLKGRLVNDKDTTYYFINSYLEIKRIIKANNFNNYRTFFILVEEKITREEIKDLVNELDSKSIKSLLITEKNDNNFRLQEKRCKVFFVKNLENKDYIIKKSLHLIQKRIERILEEEQEFKERLTVKPSDKKHKMIIGIGASSGGIETSTEIYEKLPKNIPPMLMVQHMPKVFSKLFTQKLNSVCKFSVFEAINGEVIRENTLYIAPGGYQMSVVDKGSYYTIKIENIGPYNNHNPSVDYLFNSMAKVLGNKVVAIILTGMGSDGTEGLKNIKNKGGYTIGQSKNDCVVYSMPKVPYDKGYIDIQIDYKKMSEYLACKIFKK